jgi:hypothetical protein
MVARSDEPSIANVTPALIRAATGFRFTETTTTIVKRDGEAVEEVTTTTDRYYPPDPQAALVLFQIGREVLGKDFPL